MRELMPLLLFALCLVSMMGADARDEVREVVTITRDEDGSERARRVWFARADGALYIRTTPRATWGANVLRDGFVTLHAGDGGVRYRAELVDDPERIARVHERFREKYGVRDAWADVMRFFFGGKIVFALSPFES